MSGRRATRAPRSLPALVLVLLAAWPAASEAQYIGQEPERLATLLAADPAGPGEPPAGRALIDRARDLVEAGDLGAALDTLGPSRADEGLRVRYARLLLQLRVERELVFSEPRSVLAGILQADPFFADTFDVWLGLNPSRNELQAHLARLKDRVDPRAAWQRAEVLLRLGQPREALAAIRGAAPADPESRGRIDRAQARAHFQASDDAAGQAAYERLLDRLDPSIAGLLFQDIAAIASPGERQEYAALAHEERAAFFRRFWASRDPLPVEPRNPRLGEHYRRLAAALAEYPLQSNGRGYFTDLDTFRSLAPELPYFDSSLVFEDARAARLWLDPRGLLLVRHGEPDLRIGPRPFAGTEASESWVVSGYRSRPLLYHFVRRPPVGEWTLVLNLAVAAARRGTVADDPDRILPELSGAVYELYSSRLRLHSIYQQASEARSLADFARILRAESELMAGYLSAALTFDSTSYYTEDNTLPIAVAIANFQAGGRPAIEVQLSIDLSDVDARALGEAPTLDATVVLYDPDWTTERRRVSETFPLERPASKRLGAFVVTVPIPALEPDDYRVEVFVYQPESGRVGLVKGRHEVDYVPQGSLGVSDLVLSRQVRATGRNAGEGEKAPWVPAPQRIVRKAAPVRIDFEVYNLQPDESGRARYEVEERVLTLWEKPGALSQLAGYANLAGQMFFPLYAFVGQVGAFTLSQALATDEDGLAIYEREEAIHATPRVPERVRVDLGELKGGVYTVYVTVRDLQTREVVSRFLTFQVD